MEKKEILNSLKSFVNAENELAIKEANHLIKVFNALLANEAKKHEVELSSENSENLIKLK